MWLLVFTISERGKRRPYVALRIVSKVQVHWTTRESPMNALMAEGKRKEGVVVSKKDLCLNTRSKDLRDKGE